MILGVPIFDTAWSIVRRARTRTSLATADKDHLHHRLMRLGHGQRRSVFILWAWTALLSGFVLYPTYTHSGDAIVPIGILALGLAALHRAAPAGRARPIGPTPRRAPLDTDAGEADGGPMATVEDPGAVRSTAPTDAGRRSRS